MLKARTRRARQHRRAPRHSLISGRATSGGSRQTKRRLAACSLRSRVRCARQLPAPRAAGGPRRAASHARATMSGALRSGRVAQTESSERQSSRPRDGQLGSSSVPAQHSPRRVALRRRWSASAGRPAPLLGLRCAVDRTRRAREQQRDSFAWLPASALGRRTAAGAQHGGGAGLHRARTARCRDRREQARRRTRALRQSGRVAARRRLSRCPPRQPCSGSSAAATAQPPAAAFWRSPAARAAHEDARRDADAAAAPARPASAVRVPCRGCRRTNDAAAAAGAGRAVCASAAAVRRSGASSLHLPAAAAADAARVAQQPTHAAPVCTLYSAIRGRPRAALSSTRCWRGTAQHARRAWACSRCRRTAGACR